MTKCIRVCVMGVNPDGTKDFLENYFEIEKLSGNSTVVDIPQSPKPGWTPKKIMVSAVLVSDQTEDAVEK